MLLAVSEWQSSIAHPDVADWAIVAAYLLSAALCLRAAGVAKLGRKARDGTFWRITSVLLVLLAINELLDLQTLLTVAVRNHAKASGWYGEHRRIQHLFVMILAAGAAVAGAAMLLLARGTSPAVRLALAGLVFIGLFVLLRAASFHHLDDFLASGAPDFNLGFLQEIAGSVTVAAAALIYAFSKPKRQ